MKFGFLLLIVTSLCTLGAGLAHAGDVSCQVDLLKPKINASVIVEEIDKPAKMTVAEARLKLKERQLADVNNDSENQESQSKKEAENNQENSDKVAAKSDKKTSRLGGIFDILLPSKLRNPVK